MKKIKRKNKKILIPKKVETEIEKYPMVSCEWFDIVSDSSWSSFEQIKKSELATCITKGHLLSQSKGITRIFGDYSLSDDKKRIESCRTDLSWQELSFGAKLKVLVLERLKEYEDVKKIEDSKDSH